MVGSGRAFKESSHQHVVVRGKVARVADADSAKEASIGSKNVIASGLVEFGITELFPSAKIKIRATLSKMGEHIVQPIRRQGVGDKGSSGISGCGVREINIEIAHENWGMAVVGRAIQSLCQEGDVVKMAGREISSNEGLSFTAEHYIKAKNIGAMAANRFDTPSRRFIRFREAESQGEATLVCGCSVGRVD